MSDKKLSEHLRQWRDLIAKDENNCFVHPSPAIFENFTSQALALEAERDKNEEHALANGRALCVMRTERDALAARAKELERANLSVTCPATCRELEGLREGYDRLGKFLLHKFAVEEGSLTIDSAIRKLTEAQDAVNRLSARIAELEAQVEERFTAEEFYDMLSSSGGCSDCAKECEFENCYIISALRQRGKDGKD